MKKPTNDKWSILLLCAALIAGCTDNTAASGADGSETPTAAVAGAEGGAADGAAASGAGAAGAAAASGAGSAEADAAEGVGAGAAAAGIAEGTEAGAGASSGVRTAALDPEEAADYEQDDYYTDWSATGATAIALNGAGAVVDGAGAVAAGDTVTIEAAGVYVLRGKLDDGQIVVDVPDKGVVRLVLNGVDIRNADSAAIYVAEAGKVILSLPEGTGNIVSDGSDYVYPDAETDEPDAAIFSKDDLTINGPTKPSSTERMSSSPPVIFRSSLVAMPLL